jgi:hypothetical protein
MQFDFWSPRSIKKRADRRARRRIDRVIRCVRKSRVLAEEIGQREVALLLIMAETKLVAMHDEGLLPLGALPHLNFNRLRQDNPLDR